MESALDANGYISEKLLIQLQALAEAYAIEWGRLTTLAMNLHGLASTSLRGRVTVADETPDGLMEAGVTISVALLAAFIKHPEWAAALYREAQERWPEDTLDRMARGAMQDIRFAVTDVTDVTDET